MDTGEVGIDNIVAAVAAGALSPFLGGISQRLTMMHLPELAMAITACANLQKRKHLGIAEPPCTWSGPEGGRD